MFFKMYLYDKMETLGQKIKRLRKNKNLSQVAVADAIGITRPFLTGIETGREAPGRNTLIAIANFFDVSIDWLTNNQNKEEATYILNKKEAQLLSAFRDMEPDKAEMFLKLMLDYSKQK